MKKVTLLFLFACICSLLNAQTTFSILSDSYTAWPGWFGNPKGDGSGNQYNNVGFPNGSGGSFVNNDKYMWYRRLEQTGDWKLLVNESTTGAFVSNMAGYGKSREQNRASSLVTRMTKNNLGNPDVIFILSCCNDDWSQYNRPNPGSYEWKNFSDNTYCSAMAHILSYLGSHYNADICVLINSKESGIKSYQRGYHFADGIHRDGLHQQYIDATKRICDYYGAKYIMLSNIEKSEGHPTQKGMKAIADQIVSAKIAKPKKLSLDYFYRLEGGNYVNCFTDWYQSGETIKHRDAPKQIDGYSFSGWDNEPKTMPSEASKVYGTYKKTVKYYSLDYCYRLEGGKYTNCYTDWYQAGEEIKYRSAPKQIEGYTFAGWDNEPTSMPSKAIVVTGTYKKVVNSVSVNLSAGQLAYVSDYHLDFSNVKELKAYIATGYDKVSGSISLSRVYDVPAGTGILIKGPQGEYEIPTKSSTSMYYVNLFVGNVKAVTVNETENGYVNFYLSDGKHGIGFYRVNGSQALKANRCYLSVPTSITEKGVSGSTETIALGEFKQLSYFSGNGLDFESISGINAFIATGYDYDNGTILMSRVKKVPAETGILLVGEKGDYNVPTISEASIYKTLLKGNVNATTIKEYEGDYVNYYLSNGSNGLGYYRVSGSIELKPNRSYFQIPNFKANTRSTENWQTGYYEFAEDEEMLQMSVFDFEDSTATTGIDSFKLKSNSEVYYNLQGQRVDNPDNGIFIFNGKKVVIK